MKRFFKRKRGSEIWLLTFYYDTEYKTVAQVHKYTAIFLNLFHRLLSRLSYNYEIAIKIVMFQWSNEHTKSAVWT